MKDFEYCNLRNFMLDLNDLLNEVEYLRGENVSLKKQIKQIKDHNDFIRNLTNQNHEFIGETIKQLIQK